MPIVREYTVVRREPLVEKQCPICGRVFEGLSRQRYDTSACQKRADYQRHVEQRRAYQRERYRRKKQPGGGRTDASE